MEENYDAKYSNHGISQTERILSYLNPENAKIDARSIADLLSFINKYSRLINYYSYEHHTDKIVKSGDWELLTKHPIFYTAHIASFNEKKYNDEINSASNSFQLYSQNSDKEQNQSNLTVENNSNKTTGSAITDMIYAVRVVFETITEIFSEFNYWLIESDSFSINFKNHVLSIINNNMKHYLNQATGYASFFNKHINSTNYIYLNKKFLLSCDVKYWGDFIKESHQYEKQLLEIYNKLSVSDSKIEETNFNFLTNYYGFLIELVNNIVVCRNHLKKIAQRELDILLNGDGTLRPDLALLVSFVKLFQKAQVKLNSLTKKHLDLYYKTVLNGETLPIQLDNAYVFLLLNADTPNFLLPKNTVFSAGADALGNVIKYTSKEDVIINKAQVTQVINLYQAKNHILQPKPITGLSFITGIYTQSYAFPQQNKIAPFKIFGQDQIAFSDSEMTMQECSLGFALTSDIFYFSSGNCKINVVIDLNAESFTDNFIIPFKKIFNGDRLEDQVLLAKINQYLAKSSLESINILATGNKGWLNLSCSSLLLSSITAPKLIFEITLDATSNPIIGFSSLIHKENYITTKPVIKFLFLNNSRYYLYNFFYSTKINSIKVIANVTGFRNVTLTNQLGPIKAVKPFPIFGNQPQKGSYLIMGSNELKIKGVDKLTATINWSNLNELINFSDYYKNYTETFTNYLFKVKFYTLKKQQWQAIGKNQEFQLFNEATYLDDQIMLLSTTNFDLTEKQDSVLDKDTNVNNNSMLEYNVNAISGFVKMELSNPEFGFGANLYSNSLSTVVLENAKIKMNPIVPDVLNVTKGLTNIQTETKQLPNPPFTPIADCVTFNYETSSEINLNGENSDFEFYHIGFFNSYPVIKQNNLENKGNLVNLLPIINGVGNIYLGFENLNLPETVNVFFKIKQGVTSQTSTSSNSIKWYYYSLNNVWVELKNQLNYNDKTAGLMQSGIISFDIPLDVNFTNQELTNTKIWLKGETNGSNDNLIEAIYTQAVELTFSNPSEVIRNNMLLPALSISKTINSISELSSIVQPFHSTNGALSESDNSFYIRMSERLRHKNRAVVPQDYEKLILQKFPKLYKVKCVNLQTKTAAKQVQLAVLSNVSNNIEMPKLLGSFDLQEIKEYALSIAPKNIFLKVFNVVFEKISIRCKIKFVTQDAFYLKQINEDINKFFSIYNLSKNNNVLIGGTLQKSKIVNYLQNLEYVVYVTSFSIIQTCFDNDAYHLYDSADTKNDSIVSLTPISLFVSNEVHYIETLTDSVSQTPQITGINDLIIDDNFIIN